MLTSGAFQTESCHEAASFKSLHQKRPSLTPSNRALLRVGRSRYSTKTRIHDYSLYIFKIREKKFTLAGAFPKESCGKLECWRFFWKKVAENLMRSY
jgi:hypothetical protein